MATKTKSKRTPSAMKRARQAEKRNLRNKSVKSEIKGIIKKIESAIASRNREDASNALREATRVLTLAASKGIIHKNNAARNISRLAKKVNALFKVEAA